MDRGVLMKTIGVFPLLKKPRAIEVAKELIDLLQAVDFKVALDKERARQIGREDLGLKNKTYWRKWIMAWF